MAAAGQLRAAGQAAGGRGPRAAGRLADAAPGPTSSVATRGAWPLLMVSTRLDIKKVNQSKTEMDKLINNRFGDTPCIC